MTVESPSSIRSWITALSLSLVAVAAILMIASPSHRWQPGKITEAPYGNDFLQEWVGGHIVLAGKAAQLYDNPTFEAYQHDAQVVGFQWSRASYFPPVYPPPHYWISSSLAWIPYRFATIVWIGLLVSAMGLGSWIAAKLVVGMHEFKGAALAKSILERWSWIAMILFSPTIYCFIMGQKGPFWFLIFAATWALLRRRFDGWAGVVFGLLSIKPTLFFLLPVVMLRYGRWRFLAGTTFSVILLWGGAFAVLPLEVWSGFADKLRMSSSYAGIQGYHLDWSCNLMSLSHILKKGYETELLNWIFVLPLSLYGLLLVIQPRRFDVDQPNTLWNLVVATFLISPHTYYYDLVILLLPLLWLAATDPKRSVICYFSIVASVILSPLVLETIGIPLIPVVLVGMLVTQRISSLAGNPRLQYSQNEELAY